MAVYRSSKDFVPTADSTSNVEERDVLGNKTDAAAAGAVTTTESLMAYSKQVVTNTEILNASSIKISERATAALPQSTTSTLFTVTGYIQIVEIRGFVSANIGAVPNATKLTAVGNDICATLDVDGKGIGINFSVTGTFANPLLANMNGSFESQANPITVGAGNIVLDCAGSDGGDGRIQWSLIWRPMSSDAAVAVA